MVRLLSDRVQWRHRFTRDFLPRQLLLGGAAQRYMGVIGEDRAEQNHWGEPRAAMNVQTEFEAVWSLPVVAQFGR
jgi:hypothetical protein